MSNKKEESIEEIENTKKTSKKEEVKKVEESKEEREEREEKEKINNIIEEAKQKGKITYSDLATKLNDVNPEKLDTVFDEFEKVGVDLLADDFEEEPDIEDLREVEDLKLDDITNTNFEGLYQVLAPVSYPHAASKP